MAVKDYFLPRSLAEALDLLAERGPDLLVMAGGTLAMPLINDGISTPTQVLGLRRAGLGGLRRDNGYLVIGATTTLSDVRGQAGVPVLAEAARNVGGWAVRNMGTVGGNLFAPPPAGDFAVALLALDAEVRLVGRGGERRLPLAAFYTGFLSTVVEPGELLTEVWVPVAAEPRPAVYLKYGRKQANTPAIITVAAQVWQADGQVRAARMALNGVGPHPLRAARAEACLVGQALGAASIAAAAEAAAGECEPFTDAVASAWYRRKMVRVYVSRALHLLAGQRVS